MSVVVASRRHVAARRRSQICGKNQSPCSQNQHAQQQMEGFCEVVPERGSRTRTVAGMSDSDRRCEEKHDDGSEPRGELHVCLLDYFAWCIRREIL